MTALPTASKISVLSSENILLVSQTYMKQIRKGTAANPDQAECFIMTALDRYSRMCENWIKNYDKLSGTFYEVVKKNTHHYIRDALKPLDENEVAEWAAKNNITYNHVRHLAEDFYFFQSFDDFMLFKLRWN